MDNLKNKTTVALYVFLSLGLLYVLLSYNLFGNKSFSLFGPQQSCSTQQSDRDDELGSVLAKASMEDKTVIIAMVNEAYVESETKPMLDLFLDSFWFGENTRALIDHLLIVAVDQKSYDRCRFLRLHCYKLKTHGVDFDGKEKMYMSSDFIKMMWRRTLFLGEVLKRGYNFVFTDTDIMWLRNPFPRLSTNKSIDIQISVDFFNGDQWSQKNPINTGFYSIKSNNKTISLFDSWYAKRDDTEGQKEQDVLEKMITDGVFTKLGIQVRYLNTLYFSGFCQGSNDIGVVATVHANCCRTVSAKVVDLTVVINDWRRYNKFNRNNTKMLIGRSHDSCGNSWKGFDPKRP